MTNKKFTDRKVDKVPLKKSKDYMWRYIKSKTEAEEKTERESAWDKLKDWLMVPARLASAGVVASVLILALVLNTNFSGWFTGEDSVNITRPSTVHASFEMVANAENGSGVESSSTFVLASSEDLDTDVVKDHLVVEPAVEVEVTRTEAGIYEVKPIGELNANTVYNFTIQTAEREFSWAYQVQDDFKISGTLPGNKSTYAPIDGGIEIYFSHENFNFEQAKKNFSISPAVKGSFEQYRRAFVFVPKENLAKGQIYKVNMGSGVEFGEGEMELEEDYSFQFETDDEFDNERDIISFSQQYYEMPTGRNVGLKASTYYFEQGEEESFEMQIWQYEDVDQYIASLSKTIEIPQWCYFSKQSVRHETEKLDYLGTFETFADKSGYQSYVYIPGLELDAGYYVVQVEEDGPQALLQVTDVSAYTNVSSTDSLVWVNDVSTGEASVGATVEVSGIDSSFVSNEEGIATFTTPEDWKVDFKDRVESFIKITTEDNKSLVTRVIPYYYEDHSDNYWMHFATDRPVYKAEDTIRFWGFVEGKNSDYKAEDLSVRLEYGWEEFVDENPVRVNKDGSFEGRLLLNNYNPGYYSIELWSGDKLLSSKSVEIENYITPPYDLSVSADKNAVFVGDEIEYSVSTKFFDGTAAVNIGLNYYSPGNSGDKYIYTDEDGEAIVELEAEGSTCYESSYYCNINNSDYFEVSTLSSEITDLWASTEVMVFNSQVNLELEKTSEDGNATIDFITHWVDLKAINDVENENAYSESFLGEPAKKRVIEGTVTETYWEKVEDGKFYDFISKKNKTQYKYVKHESVVDTFEVGTGDDNLASYNFSYDEDKFYRVYATTKDDSGLTSSQVAYVYGNSSRSDEYDYYKVKILNGNDNSDEPELYGWWSDTGKSFDITDDGIVNITAPNQENGEKAKEWIEKLTYQPKVGDFVEGPIIKILEFGAIVEFSKGSDGLIHISELADQRVNRVEDVVKEGDIVRVKVVNIDKAKGRVGLSLKQAKTEGSAAGTGPKPAPGHESPATTGTAQVAPQQVEQGKGGHGDVVPGTTSVRKVNGE